VTGDHIEGIRGIRSPMISVLAIHQRM